MNELTVTSDSDDRDSIVRVKLFTDVPEDFRAKRRAAVVSAYRAFVASGMSPAKARAAVMLSTTAFNQLQLIMLTAAGYPPEKLAVADQFSADMLDWLSDVLDNITVHETENPS